MEELEGEGQPDEDEMEEGPADLGENQDETNLNFMMIQFKVFLSTKRYQICKELVNLYYRTLML
ncbi:hypothetical protein DSO57_1014302 [Entomophthora muscae]|uniref:Uncharacterized protein n=1 Tax=Entomophthora muscae TaxID=34485 RepID=A0ACC2RWP5_9FUNG|nr:hypothetical protein DSO57_1014302 [Entomophthora muscae]